MGVSVSTQAVKELIKFWGNVRSFWGHISINGHMDLKLGGCSHQRGFLYWYFQGHLRSSWGYLSIYGSMDLKLGGCSHHSERIYLLVPPGSSEVMLVLKVVWT